MNSIILSNLDNVAVVCAPIALGEKLANVMVAAEKIDQGYKVSTVPIKSGEELGYGDNESVPSQLGAVL